MFFIFVITFEPNKIYNSLAPQNDRLNLSFVKSYLVGEEMTTSDLKMAIYDLQFGNQSLLTQHLLKQLLDIYFDIRPSLWKIR